MSVPATGVSSTVTRSGVEVRLEGLSRNYGDVKALDGLDLTLHPGELVVLLGPSGCGKTTTLRLLAGLEGQIEMVERDHRAVVPAQFLQPHLDGGPGRTGRRSGHR